MDYTLLLIVVLLVVIGLVILYSTSAYNGQVKFHDSFLLSEKAGVCDGAWNCTDAVRGRGWITTSGRDWQYLVIWRSCTFGCGHVVWQRN